MGTTASDLKHSCDSSIYGGGGNGGITPPRLPSLSSLHGPISQSIFAKREVPGPSSPPSVIINYYRPVLGGNSIRHAGKNRLLLTGLGEKDDINEEDIFFYFYRKFDSKVRWVEIRRDPATQSSCGYAMVCLELKVHDLVVYRKHLIKGSLLTALPMASPCIPLRHIPPSEEKEHKEQKSYSVSSLPLRAGPCTIYVGGFAALIDKYGQDEDFIASYFSKYGTVEEVDFPRHRNKYPDDYPVSCRWALVRFAHRDSAIRAVCQPSHYFYRFPVVVHQTDGTLPEEYSKRGITQLEQETWDSDNSI